MFQLGFIDNGFVVQHLDQPHEHCAQLRDLVGLTFDEISKVNHMGLDVRKRFGISIDRAALRQIAECPLAKQPKFLRHDFCECTLFTGTLEMHYVDQHRGAE